jgi:hypothetical protein
LKFVVMSSEGHLSHNPPSFLLSFFLVGKCCFVCFLSVCVAMDLGLADWLDLIRSCAVSSTSSCPQHLVDFQPTRVVKSAATAKRGHFHTGTLSPWQLLLTLAQLCSSRALQVAPGRLIHSAARGEGAALFYIYSIEPASLLCSAFCLPYTRTAIFNVSSSLDSSRTGEKPLEDATLHKFPLSSHFTSS